MPPRRPTHLSPAHINAPPVSPVEPSPTTTIETSSHRSIIWPIPEPPPEVQHQQDSRRPTLRFFPTQRPRVRLDTVHSLQIPPMDEKTPISGIHPGLGIMNGPPKPPSIEISAPIEEDVEDIPNIAERIEKRLYQYSISGNILKRWLFEIISWTFSAVCMAAVIGVLITYKDDPLNNWSLADKTGLTLNAYISILSKMAGAALILPVSEALGQLKWSWFQQNSKQMWDFEIFDNASRGPWGSLLLLMRTKGKALAALGAMITICMMALDPFFQQVVSFPQRWALEKDLTSKIPKTVRYDPGVPTEYVAGMENAANDPDIYHLMGKFAYGNGTQPIPYGNDWTHELQGLFDLKEPYPNATMCGYFLNATSDTPTLMSGYLFNPNDSSKGEALLTRAFPLTSVTTREPLYGNGTIMFKDLRNTIADVIIVSAEGGVADTVYQNRRPIAHECALLWCVKTIKSTYDMGQYSEEIIATYTNTSSGDFPWQQFQAEDEFGQYTEVFYLQDINIDNGTTPDGHDISGYGASNHTATAIITGFADIFPSFTTVVDESAVQTLRYKTWKTGAPFTRMLDYNPWLHPNISTHMDRFATAMTNVIRSAPSKEMISGQSFSREAYVSVRWEWLTLPIGLLLMSFVFLAATIFKSALEKDQLGVLKNSAILTLLYGVPDNMRTQLTRSSSRGTPRAKAKELKVKLNPNMGWRVSGNLFSPLTPRPPQPPPGWI
ncbi:unnamed protein product [Alternaria alternata]